ncbi:MAG TPA: hypothetical protein PKJ23_09900, partial [bacterium]|nr:hypothetical protein [bacterium]
QRRLAYWVAARQRRLAYWWDRPPCLSMTRLSQEEQPGVCEGPGHRVRTTRFRFPLRRPLQDSIRLV